MTTDRHFATTPEGQRCEACWNADEWKQVAVDRRIPCPVSGTIFIDHCPAVPEPCRTCVLYGGHEAYAGEDASIHCKLAGKHIATTACPHRERGLP